mmetsp:Transcript_90691/g.194505  ORF Transcript_90691/g.194505 Transcript_90691/m.194505 type:complete len:472 (+) Transcript_90691:392-1807(+)
MDVVQPLPVVHVQRVLRESLDGRLHVLALPIDQGKEGHVANAEAAVLDDGGTAAVGGRVHGPVLPGVAHTGEVEHGLEHVQHQLPRRWDGPLMHKPAGHAGTWKVLSPGDDVGLDGSQLACSADVLDREGAIADDRNVGFRELLIVHVVIHPVANVTVEDVLSRILDDPIPRHTPREAIHDRACLLEGLATIELVHSEVVIAIKCLFLSNDVDLRNIGLELANVQHAVLLGSKVEVLENPGLLRPHLPLCGPAAAPLLGILCELRPPPDMKGTDLRLQLRCLVCGRDPAIAAHLVVAVEANEVAAIAIKFRVVDARLDAVVASPDDSDRVRPLVCSWLECLNALDSDLSTDFLIVQLLSRTASRLHHKVKLFNSDHAGRCDGLLDIGDPCARLHRESHRLRSTINGQGGLCERRTVPSADLLGGLALYILPRRVEDVEPHFRHLYHVLLRLPSSVPFDRGRRQLPILRHAY